MISTHDKFKKNNIKSVNIRLLNGQVELIKHALELYGFNTKIMTGTEDDELKAEKIAQIAYTYDQIVSCQAEQQVNINDETTEDNNKITCFEDIMKDFNNSEIEREFKVI